MRGVHGNDIAPIIILFRFHVGLEMGAVGQTTHCQTVWRTKCSESAGQIVRLSRGQSNRVSRERRTKHPSVHSLEDCPKEYVCTICDGCTRHFVQFKLDPSWPKDKVGQTVRFPSKRQAGTSWPPPNLGSQKGRNFRTRSWLESGPGSLIRILKIDYENLKVEYTSPKRTQF